MKFYRSIDTLPIWNYDKWLNSEDARYLLKVEDYDQLPEVNKKTLSEIENTAIDIYYQASEFELGTSKRNELIFNLTKKFTNLEFQYNHVNNLITLLSLAGPEPEILKLLSDAGYSIREGKDFEPELKRIFNQNKNKVAKINEVKAELESMTREGSGKTQIIEDVQVAIERHNNRDIDMRKTTVKKWLILKNNLYREIEKQQLKAKK